MIECKDKDSRVESRAERESARGETFKRFESKHWSRKVGGLATSRSLFSPG